MELTDFFLINLGIAFIAGVVSFFAPCVVVLIPAFLSHLAGVSLSDSEEIKRQRWSIFYNTVFFVLGFTFVFVTLGAALGALSTFIGRYQIWLSRIGGLLIIYFGLVSLRLLPSPFKQGRGLSVQGKSSIKFVSSFLVGSTFAIGWSSCVGPILAAILILAGSGASVVTGVLLLLMYSLGLMLPFLIVGLFTSRSSVYLSSHTKLIERISMLGGVILIILGVLVFTDTFSILVGRLYALSPFSI